MPTASKEESVISLSFHCHLSFSMKATGGRGAHSNRHLLLSSLSTLGCVAQLIQGQVTCKLN